MGNYKEKRTIFVKITAHNERRLLNNSYLCNVINNNDEHNIGSV